MVVEPGGKVRRDTRTGKRRAPEQVGGRREAVLREGRAAVGAYVTPQRTRNLLGSAAILELLGRQDRGERWAVERVTTKDKSNGRAGALGPLFEGVAGGCGVAVVNGEAGRESA